MLLRIAIPWILCLVWNVMFDAAKMIVCMFSACLYMCNVLNHVCVNRMTALKTVVANLNWEEKLVGKNYDIWHCKIQYLLDKLKVLKTLTNLMDEHEQGNSAQNCRDIESYKSWQKKDCCVRFSMFTRMNNNLIGKFESYSIAQDIWITLKEKFGGTTVTQLCAGIEIWYLKHAVWWFHAKEFEDNVFNDPRVEVAGNILLMRSRSKLWFIPSLTHWNNWSTL